MAPFKIPSDKSELLSDTSRQNYVVENIVIPALISDKLKDARICFREDGSEFILNHFDTYYSILHNSSQVAGDLIFKAYEDLHKAVETLNEELLVVLDNPDNLSEVRREKMLDVTTMLIYIYVQFVIFLEEDLLKKSKSILSKTQTTKTKTNVVNKLKVLMVLNNLIQQDICLLWDPPILEDSFIKLVASSCYVFLQNPEIKQEKEVRTTMFGLFGNLVKLHNYGPTLVIRLIQMIRTYEHVVRVVPDGIKLLVEQFNCHSLVGHLIREATEWQEDGKVVDNQGTRNCSTLLTDMAELMPSLILPELMYLDQYLSYDSVPLRISILNVITEIILKVFTKHETSDQEKESRDDLLNLLIEHARDTAALVRSKVMQNLTKLQIENAIPLKYQLVVLAEVSLHLKDKGVLVRKFALICVRAFLEHNPFGANLQLKNCQEELERKQKMLSEMEASYKQLQDDKLAEMEAEWTKIQPELEEIIAEQLSIEEEEECGDVEIADLDKDKLIDIIRYNLSEKRYLESFKICRILKEKITEWKEMEDLETDNEVQLYVAIIHALYMDVSKIIEELRVDAGMTQEDVDKIMAMEKAITYLEKAVNFLKLIDSTMNIVEELLFTESMSDMTEAINFFITACQFQIDNAFKGVLAMLALMQSDENERKQAIVNAFKSIYLTTNANNMTEHTTTILTRLIALLKDIKLKHVDYFESIVSEWTAKGMLDNSVIDMCWQYYMKRIAVTDEESRAAAELLRMASMGRNTIIRKNINVVATVAFGDNGRNDMLYLDASCRLLAVAGRDKVDVKSKESPFKIDYRDPLFDSLVNILCEQFFKDVPFYSQALSSGISFIAKVCSKPLDVCSNLLNNIHNGIMKSGLNHRSLKMLCLLLGLLAINVLGYLDSTVYKELKRRNYVRDEEKESTKKKKSTVRNSEKSKKNDTILGSSVIEESLMEGAAAEDRDAEFVLNVLENNVVFGSGSLSAFTPLLIRICTRFDLYNDADLQNSAVVALMRFMLVSNKFCRENIRLLFTILQKTTSSDIKSSILIHLSDLLTRFPNTVEPWCPQITAVLKDSDPDVRKTAFFALAGLILKDMVRPQRHLSDMALCIIDDDAEVNQMSRIFFRRLAQKDNNLSNFLPDIFSYLVKMENVDEQNLRSIMKFLFNLIDKTKRMDSLVDRFCSKYRPVEDYRLNRNITYCLTLISYNDKALKKLHDKFPMYKFHVHDQEIYSLLKQILTECSKTKVGRVNLKPAVDEIEKAIASVFEINEDGETVQKPPPAMKSAKKTYRKSAKKHKSRRKPVMSDDDEDADDEDLENTIDASKGTK